MKFHPQAKGNTQSGHDHGEMIAKKTKLCKYVPTCCVLPPAADHKAFALVKKIEKAYGLLKRFVGSDTKISLHTLCIINYRYLYYCIVCSCIDIEQ